MSSLFGSYYSLTNFQINSSPFIILTNFTYQNFDVSRPLDISYSFFSSAFFFICKFSYLFAFDFSQFYRPLLPLCPEIVTSSVLKFYSIETKDFNEFAKLLLYQVRHIRSPFVLSLFLNVLKLSSIDFETIRQPILFYVTFQLLEKAEEFYSFVNFLFPKPSELDKKRINESLEKLKPREKFLYFLKVGQKTDGKTPYYEMPIEDPLCELYLNCVEKIEVEEADFEKLSPKHLIFLVQNPNKFDLNLRDSLIQENPILFSKYIETVQTKTFEFQEIEGLIE